MVTCDARAEIRRRCLHGQIVWEDDGITIVDGCVLSKEAVCLEALDFGCPQSAVEVVDQTSIAFDYTSLLVRCSVFTLVNSRKY